MTDYSELIKRLRICEQFDQDQKDAADALEAQAKEIAEKDARIAKLGAALKTCADELEVWIDELYSVGSVLPEHKLRYKRNIESVRTARAVLKGEREASD
jgi:hypothetical protein